MSLILALDGATRRCGAWLVSDDTILAGRESGGDRGQAVSLTTMTRDVLRQAGIAVPALHVVAATVGPGSFTGIRAALALAHGLCLGADLPLVGVTLGEAIAELYRYYAEPLASPSRELWIATDSRRGRIFLERGSLAEAFPLDALPHPAGPVAIAGDQSVPVAAQLAAQGFDIMLTDLRQPDGVAIARAALKRLHGELPPRLALPLYIDAPAVRLPDSHSVYP